MRDPDYREFDESAFGAVVFGGDGVNRTAPLIVDDESGQLRPLRVRAAASGAFSDMLAVCNDDARGWRHWWSAGRVWGERCGGRPISGAYFHFMCAKWSHAFWKPHGRVCDAHTLSRWNEPRWNITFTADPASINCGDACRDVNTSALPSQRGRQLSSAAIQRPEAAHQPARPRHRRLFKSIADDALLTFHDPFWSVRPQRADPECNATRGGGAR